MPSTHHTSAETPPQKPARKFYLRERHNPQLGTYYVMEGQMSKTAAKRAERGSLYGSNTMHAFSTESEYNAEILRLQEAGERVQ